MIIELIQTRLILRRYLIHIRIKVPYFFIPRKKFNFFHFLEKIELVSQNYYVFFVSEIKSPGKHSLSLVGLPRDPKGEGLLWVGKEYKFLKKSLKTS